MARLVLRLSVSIDGVMEAPEHGLDFSRTRSPEGVAWLAGRMGEAGAHLMGRKSFSTFASFWPTASGILARLLNDTPKIAFSRAGFDPAAVTAAPGWADARVVTGDLGSGIAELKAAGERDLMAHGGIEFARSLAATGLVDEFLIAQHPVAAGRGVRLFDDLNAPLPLTLVESRTFSTGALALVYRPAQP